MYIKSKYEDVVLKGQLLFSYQKKGLKIIYKMTGKTPK